MLLEPCSSKLKKQSIEIVSEVTIFLKMVELKVDLHCATFL